MKWVKALLGLLVISVLWESGYAARKSEYLQVIQRARDRLSAQYDSLLAQWKKSYVPTAFGGYAPPMFPVDLAELDAFLYQVTGNRSYAEEAVRAMVDYVGLRDLYPKEFRTFRKEYQFGLPPITSFFHLVRFIRAYLWVKDADMAPGHRRIIEGAIAESADYTFRYHEWGPMNRAILRAAGLQAAARALPNHPNASRWSRLARRLAQSSWGKWTIEDAQIYNAVWLEGLLMYADLCDRTDLWDSPVTRYYFRYFTRLLTPVGYIAHYGDNHGFWNQTLRYAACLEKGASVYRDPEAKYAADVLFRTYINDPKSDKGRVFPLINAYLWCDDSVPLQKPTSKSQEVLEDLFGKKIVFRSGWEPDDLFLLLNYRDGGKFGRIPKEYLITTIPIETEKPHHGHSDENSLGPFIYKGTVLLDYPTYFERGDFYHNRIVARRQAPPSGYRLMPFLRQEENHHIVDTEKLHFYTFEEVEVSRTRLTDRERGYQWDRVVVYLKPDPLFVVFDGIKILEDGLFHFSNLWHTHRVVNADGHWYETRILEVGDQPGRWVNPEDYTLIIYFPEGDTKREGVEALFTWSFVGRSRFVVYRSVTDSMKSGDRLAFTTVLIPFDRKGNPAERVRNISLLRPHGYPNGVGVRIEGPKGTRIVTVRLNLEMEVLPEEWRPRYTFESGKMEYTWTDAKGRTQHFATDARFAYLRIQRGQVRYAFVEATRLILNQKELFSSFVNSFYTLQPDGKLYRSAREKWESWEDVVKEP